MFFAIFILTPIFPSKNAEMANEHQCDSANLENDINMSLKQQFLKHKKKNIAIFNFKKQFKHFIN